MLCDVYENNESRAVEPGLFDRAGQEEYCKLWPLTFANADVFIICYPAEASMERLEDRVKDEWVSEIRRACPGAPFAIAAIHHDCDELDNVSSLLLSVDLKERTKFAEEIGACGFFDIWPCTRIRIDECLTEVSRDNKVYTSVPSGWGSSSPCRSSELLPPTTKARRNGGVPRVAVVGASSAVSLLLERERISQSRTSALGSVRDREAKHTRVLTDWSCSSV